MVMVQGFESRTEGSAVSHNSRQEVAREAGLLSIQGIHQKTGGQK